MEPFAVVLARRRVVLCLLLATSVVKSEGSASASDDVASDAISTDESDSIDSDETTEATTTAPCPSSFEFLNNRCYLFNPATRPKRDFLWQAARDECQGLATNADLVSIETVAEYNLIVSRLAALFPTPLSVNFWTGAQWDGTNAVWVATNEITNLPSSVEPNRVTAVRNCGRIFYSATGLYSHRGLTCAVPHFRRVGYVCEIQP